MTGKWVQIFHAHRVEFDEETDEGEATVFINAPVGEHESSFLVDVGDVRKIASMTVRCFARVEHKVTLENQPMVWPDAIVG